MSRTRIKRCTCEHEFQDKQYGKRRRVHNELGDESHQNWRCTVCGREKGA